MNLSILVIFSALCLVAGAFSEPDSKRLAETEVETDKSMRSEARNPFRRLVLINKCSKLGEKCHPLQYCCEGLACKYESYLPLQGTCWYKLKI